MNHRHRTPVPKIRFYAGALAFVAVVACSTDVAWTDLWFGPATDGGYMHGNGWLTAGLVAAVYLAGSGFLGSRQPRWGTFAWAAVLFTIPAVTAALHASVVWAGLFSGAAILCAVVAAAFAHPAGRGGPIGGRRERGRTRA